MWGGFSLFDVQSFPDSLMSGRSSIRSRLSNLSNVIGNGEFDWLRVDLHKALFHDDFYLESKSLETQRSHQLFVSQEYEDDELNHVIQLFKSIFVSKTNENQSSQQDNVEESEASTEEGNINDNDINKESLYSERLRLWNCGAKELIRYEDLDCKLVFNKRIGMRLAVLEELYKKIEESYKKRAKVRIHFIIAVAHSTTHYLTTLTVII
jgi:hypothetical protein